jgi:DNA-binding transcriptional ArsR family regulator
MVWGSLSGADRQERVFKALADGTRREILDLLRDQPMTTGNICNHFPGLDRCTVMQHLGVLEKSELIVVKREGRHRWNYLNVAPIREVYDRWISPYASSSVDLLTRMRRGIEGSG